ncbi:MAG: FAD binding domain-containing protein [Nitrospinota bacterium]
MRPFELHTPTGVGEALEVLSRHGQDAMIMAGGTDVLIQLQQEVKIPGHVVLLKRIRGLEEVRSTDDGGMILGAGVRLADIEKSPVIRGRYPVLAQAASHVASPLIRHTATLGGNLCLDNKCWYYDQTAHWKESHHLCLKADGDICHVVKGGEICYAISNSDTAPALIALRARVRIIGPKGERLIPLQELYTGIGETPIALEPNEILVEVHLLPPKPSTGSSYQRLATRGAIDFAFACAAAVAVLDPDGQTCADARIALNSVSMKPVDAVKSSEMLVGKAPSEHLFEAAAKEASKEARPFSDIEKLAGYRGKMARVLVRKAIEAAFEMAG